MVLSMKMIKVSDLKDFVSTFFADPVLQLAGMAIANNAPTVDAVEIDSGIWTLTESASGIPLASNKEYVDTDSVRWV